MLLRIYHRAERTGLNFNCPDVHQRIQVAFQKRVLGGRLTGEKSSDESDKKFFGTAENRAKRLRTVWITDTQTRATIELLLKNAFAFRKNIIEVNRRYRNIHTLIEILVFLQKLVTIIIWR